MKTGEFFRHLHDDVHDEQPYHYRRCGLDNIWLLNGFEREHEDGEDYISVLDVDGLHQAISLHLVHTHKVLEPKEIRFLRKTLDLTQAELGRLIGQSDQQVARWEKGGNNISGPADRLLRILVDSCMAKRPGDVQDPMGMLQSLEQLDAEPEEKLEFCKDADAWREKVPC